MVTLGILGGGQLGRMIALAAAEYGINTTIFDPDPLCCAGKVSNLCVGDFNDYNTLKKWAVSLNAVTLEFENIPLNCLKFLSHHVNTHPNADLLQKTQDRLDEKQWLQKLGIPVAPFQRIDTIQDLLTAKKKFSGNIFLKTRRFGYDGKGQIHIKSFFSLTEIQKAFTQLNTPCIAEQSIDFRRELSIIIARNLRGEISYLPLVENQHEDLANGGKILRTTLAPAPNISKSLTTKAIDIAKHIADSITLCGLLAIEMFETGGGNIASDLCINELAPRPHNSGHWSINGAEVSQFHLLVRAALNLPLPNNISYRPIRMTNLIGHEASSLPSLLQIQKQWIHLYGKEKTKSGRKMGHINALI